MAQVTVTSGILTGNLITPTGSLRWEELGDSLVGTWADWTNWNPYPNDITVEVLADAGSKGAFTPSANFVFEGSMTADLLTGDELDSNDAIVTPTTTTVTEDGITYSEAQFFQFNITVTTDSATALPTMTLPNMSLGDVITEEYLTNIDTSTLSSDSLGARELDTNIAVATTMVITAHQEGVTYANGEFQDRQYAVPDDFIFQENAIVVNTVTKSPPTIRCFDLNGESIDAIIDARIVGLPFILLTNNGIEAAI